MNNSVNLYRSEDAAQNLILSGARQGGAGETLDLRALFATLRRRRRLFLAVAGTIFLAAVVLTFLTTPLFTATTTVVIDTLQAQLVPNSEQVLPSGGDTTGVVDTQVQVIMSTEMAGKVDDALQLDSSAIFDPSKVRVGIRRSVYNMLGGTSAPDPRTYDRQAQREFVISQLIGHLSVLRVGTTYSLQIAFSSPSPVFAAAIANEFARQYSNEQTRDKEAANAKARVFLSGRIDQLQQQAEADTRAVQEYRIKNNLLSTNGAALTEAEVSTYNQQVATARAQAAEDSAQLSTAQRQLSTGTTGNGNDVGVALTSPVVSSLRTQRAELAAQLANLQSRYGPRHPEVLKTQQQLANLDASLKKEVDSVIAGLRARSNVSQQRLGSINGSLAGARGTLMGSNHALIGFDDLNRKAQTSQALYETYLNRYKETVAQEGTEQSQARVVTWATVPSKQSSPILFLNLFLAVFLGIGAGLAVSLVSELLFSGLTTGEDIEHRLGVRYLGGVPLLSTVVKRAKVPGDAVVEHPHSAFAEAFRSMRTSIDYVVDAQVQVVMITSALPQEGKTTTSFCLARSVAMQGEKVVIVDCDSRRRSLNRFIPEQREAGLVEVLRGDAMLEEALVLDEASGAYILPLNRTKLENLDLIAGEAMAQLIQTLRADFTYIILDTAPILPIADARLLAPLADAVVMAVRWRKTPDHAVRAAIRLLPAGRSYLAGVALTRINMKKQARFGYGDPSFYYHQYKAYYG